MIPTRHNIKSVAVILGSSRSGSSFLFKNLSKLSGLLSPLGEETPIYRNLNIGWINSPFDSDALKPDEFSSEQLDHLARELLSDVGGAVTSPPNLISLAQRLHWQWPSVSAELFLNDLKSANQPLEREQIEAIIKKNGGSLDFYNSDLKLPENESVELPQKFLEEPPYVFPKPRSSPTPELWSTSTLLLKTSTNAYRIPFLKKLFPNAQFKWILLTRHPMASIQGLVDGWDSPWFQSHNMEDVAPLHIPDYPSSWWKFDAPPGWQNFRDKSVVEIAAFQWVSAYHHILINLKSSDNVHQLAYEDLLANPEEVFKKIFSFLSLKSELPVQHELAIPVMNTGPLSPARWKEHKEDFIELLNFPLLSETAQLLNYDIEKDFE